MLTRRTVLCALAAPVVRAQEPLARATVPLVVVPATVSSPSGKLVSGLNERDFVLYDEGRPQAFHLEEQMMPVSLVLAVHATVDARKPLQRMREIMSLFEPLVTGEGGEAALVAIRDEPSVAVDFTGDVHKIGRAVRSLEARGAGCALVDAIALSARLLAPRPRKRRRIIVAMTESRDRSSKADLGETLVQLQRAGITVYSLTYSPLQMQYAREAPVAPDQ